MELGGLVPLCITVRSNLKADNPNYGIIKPCTQCPLFKKTGSDSKYVHYRDYWTVKNYLRHKDTNPDAGSMLSQRHDSRDRSILVLGLIRHSPPTLRYQSGWRNFSGQLLSTTELAQECRGQIHNWRKSKKYLSVKQLQSWIITKTQPGFKSVLICTPTF